MTKQSFSKTLSANDVGATGGHQGGILVPKSETELLAFLPHLDPTVKNPDAWIVCKDEGGAVRRFRFVYYNNKLHDPAGTRNEYRITYMTGYFREMRARERDTFQISRNEGSDSSYSIRIVRSNETVPEPKNENVLRIKITSSWQRVH